MSFRNAEFREPFPDSGLGCFSVERADAPCHNVLIRLSDHGAKVAKSRAPLFQRIQSFTDDLAFGCEFAACDARKNSLLDVRIKLKSHKGPFRSNSAK